MNIRERMKHYQVTGLSMAVVKDGEMSEAECFGTLEIGTRNNVKLTSMFNACSISKFVTTILVMKLVDQGVLNLDEDVNKYLTSWKIPNQNQSKKVTLRNLLCHQSGVKDPKGSFQELNPLDTPPNMVDILNGKTPYCHERIQVVYEPGSDFHYSDAGYCIIQQVIEDTCKLTFEEVMNEYIFLPLQMKNSFYELRDTANIACGHNKKGLVKNKNTIYPYPAASGLWTTPSDLALLMVDLMKSVRGHSCIGLSAISAKEIVRPQGCKEWTGLGVFLEHSNDDVEISSLGWGVGYQCMMLAYPNTQSGIVMMTNTDLGVHQLDGIIGEIYQSMNDSLKTS